MSREIKIPRICTIGEIFKFLKAVEEIFSLENKFEPDVVFNMLEIEDIDLTGLLLNYKIIEFAVEHNCICKSKLSANDLVEDKLMEYYFWDLLQAYIKEKKANYKKLDFKIKGEFFIAPVALLRKDKFSKEKIKDDFLPKIEEYYKNIPEERNIDKTKVSSMILQCFSEILLNFWEHAVEDTKSIIVANGNSDYAEIICADTGNGIISTLKPVLNKLYSKDDILAKAMEKFVTSKKETDHMGCGLWILNQITNLSKGRLYIFSEGAYYLNHFGRFAKGECSYWKGTIIYMFLRLSTPKTLSDIEDFTSEEFNDLKINFQ
jgi:hypothetical protein